MANNNKANNKAALRKMMREQRRALSSDQQVVAAQGLLAQLQTIPAFLAAAKISMYLVNDGEIDPAAVMQWCWQHGKQAYVPIVVEQALGKTINGTVNKYNRTLLFAHINEQTVYAENRFGIREPVVGRDQLIAAQSLDMVLMPLVAFDQKGNRIGMGGGFYDTTFAFLKEATTNKKAMHKPHLIGIAHELQKVEAISAEHWDIPLARVVTDIDIYNGCATNPAN